MAVPLADSVTLLSPPALARRPGLPPARGSAALCLQPAALPPVPEKSQAMGNTELREVSAAENGGVKEASALMASS